MKLSRPATIGIIVAVVIIAAGAWAFGRYHGQTKVAAVASGGSYIALGDSVAAGLGLKTYSDASACDRTNESYPNVVASKLNLSLTSFACSGASSVNGLLGGQTVNNLLVASQLSQTLATAPKYISVTMGANDMDWTTLLTKCYTATCGTAADTAAVTARLATLTINLKQFLSSLSTHYGAATPHVVLTGYHQVFPSVKPDCASLTSLDAGEIAWARDQQVRLNDAIATSVTGFSFAKFAPVDYTGHELCTTDSWVQDLQSTAPFHPNEEGQPAYATAVETAFNSFK